MTGGAEAVTVCCDVGGSVGKDRLVRCLALAEELVSRGTQVTFLSDVEESAWAQMQIRARRLDVLAPPATTREYVDLLDRLSSDAVVFDRTGTDDPLPETRRPTLVIAGPDWRGAGADLVVAPDVQAEDSEGTAAADRTELAGLDYALIRNDVLANRPISPPQRRPVEVPRVTAVFDDPASAGAGPAMARVLAATGRSFEATFVADDERARADIAGVRLAPRQRIDVLEPSWRLHERLGRSDVVLGAAGPSAYEWLCMGAPVGLVWTSEEQVERYRRLMVRRVVVGVGAAAELAEDPSRGVDKMTRLLSDARERSRLGESGWRLVDGFGRTRVVDRLLEQIGGS